MYVRVIKYPIPAFVFHVWSIVDKVSVLDIHTSSCKHTWPIMRYRVPFTTKTNSLFCYEDFLLFCTLPGLPAHRISDRTIDDESMKSWYPFSEQIDFLDSLSEIGLFNRYFI